MKSLLIPCLVVTALTAGHVLARDPDFEDSDFEESESVIIERLPKAHSRSRTAKRSFFEMSEFVIFSNETELPVVPANAEANSAGGPADAPNAGAAGTPGQCDPCYGGDWMDDCYKAPDCKRKGALTFTPGMRTQGRYTYDDLTNQNDFFIRRFRLKGTGAVYDVGTYGTELRFDGAERFGAASPLTASGIVENAWVCFKLVENNVYLKAGLYDVPFSRSVLTSDSKILLMDRTITSGALTTIGVADNTVGLTIHGRPMDGHLEYAIGAYDNIRFDAVGKNSNGLMPAGRVAWYFWEPAVNGSASGKPDGYADYRGSYLGKDQRLVVAAQFASLPNVREGASEFDLNAWGVDVFFCNGPWVFEADYSWFREDKSVGGPNLTGQGWTVQGGYLLNCCWELAARYQDLKDPITPLNGSVGARWTSVGVNYYIHEHNLKVQSDYTWKNESGIELDNNIFQVQLQMDF